MATYGKKLLDNRGNVILPKTRSSLVYMDDNTTVENKISGIINGSITVGNSSKLGGQAGTWWVPTGIIVPYGGKAAPSGWLLCQGQAISRTTYSSLFSVISTTYGSGDGSTTFNLPDLRGRVPVGVDSENSVGVKTGEKTYLLNEWQLLFRPDGWQVNTGSGTWFKFVQYTGDSQSPLNLMQPSIYTNYIIKT